MQQNLNMDLFAIGRSSFRKCGWFLSITLDRSLPIGLNSLVESKGGHHYICNQDKYQLIIYGLFSLVESEGGKQQDCHQDR